MFQKKLKFSTEGEGQVINISDQVSRIVSESKVVAGLANIFVTGSTAAVTTIEYEEGVIRDFIRALSVLAPDTADYAHNSRWGDGNGRSHVKSSCIGTSVTVPVVEGRLACGTWQQVVLVELDVNAPRERTVIITVQGDLKS